MWMQRVLRRPAHLRMTWDLFELVMALEEEYDVEIPAEDLEELTTVGAVMEYLKGKGAEA